MAIGAMQDASAMWLSRNHTVGNQGSCGHRSNNGSAPRITMNNTPCANSDTRAKMRGRRVLRRIPCSARKLKNANTHAPPVAAKFDTTFAAKDGLAFQGYAVTAAKSNAGIAVSATVYAAKIRSS